MSELQLTNDVANIPGETVIRYGDAVGANDAIIEAPNQSDAARNAALDNLANGTYSTITAGQGRATLSTIVNYVNGLTTP